MGVQVGGLDVVTLLGAIAGLGCRPESGRSRLQSGRHWTIASSYCSCLLPGCHAMRAIAGVPLLGAIVGAMAGCHCSVPLPDASYQLWRSSRWVPLLGAIARLLVCHCWVPLWGAMAGCHCWCHCCVPLRETIARKN